MKRIKNILIGIVVLCLGISYTACEEIGPGALEKPPGGDITIDTIFSSTEYAERVLWYSYTSLRSGIIRKGRSQGIGQNLQADITDFSHNFMSWGGAMTYYYSGDLNSSNSSTNDWPQNHCVLPYTDQLDQGVRTWKAIRNCHTFLDHVYKVPDMTDETKEQMRAEAKAIIAYNYLELFRNYGGVPWISRSYAPDDDFSNPRLTVEATVDSIVNLLDEAIPDLPWQLEEADYSTWAGRFTQAGAMALKTRLLLFAASPLFNSAEPYLEGDAATEKMTWYGNYDAARWQRAADAAKELIDKVEAQGAYALEQAATADVWGYREAYRKAYMSRYSSEILISVRDNVDGPPRWGGNMHDVNLNYGGGTCTDEFMRQFPMDDGTPITDPTSGWNEFVDPLGCEGDGDARQFSRDPRLYETMLCPNDDWAGQQVENWKNKPTNEAWPKHTAGPRRTQGSGSTVMRKFQPGWTSGIPIPFIQFPYMRLPEIYLSYAEALVMAGGSEAVAKSYINKVRNRVGLDDMENIPSLAALSGQGLVDHILAERACEFGFEQVRWFDITRHKLEASLSAPLHNVWIHKNDDGTLTYTYPEINVNTRVWWLDGYDMKKWFLLPFPIDEVQKGYGLIQNPGW